MPGLSTTDQLIAQLPSLIAVVGLAIAALANRSRLASLLDRVSHVGLGRVSVGFAEPLAQAVREKGSATSTRWESVSPEDSPIARRLEASTELLAGARVLWLDGVPSNNRNEIRVLERLGARVTVVRRGGAARTHLEDDLVDVVITNWTRPDDDLPDGDAALTGALASAPAVIFYVGRKRPCPTQAYGLTAYPDELFDLILDALAGRPAKQA